MAHPGSQPRLGYIPNTASGAGIGELNADHLPTVSSARPPLARACRVRPRRQRHGRQRQRARSGSRLRAVPAGRPIRNGGGCEVQVAVRWYHLSEDRRHSRVGEAGHFRAGSPQTYSGANPDTGHTLAVDLAMSGQTLPTAANADGVAGRSLCYADGELMAYGAIAPTEATLTTLPIHTAAPGRRHITRMPVVVPSPSSTTRCSNTICRRLMPGRRSISSSGLSTSGVVACKICRRFSPVTYAPPSGAGALGSIVSCHSASDFAATANNSPDIARRHGSGNQSWRCNQSRRHDDSASGARGKRLGSRTQYRIPDRRAIQ